MTIEQIRCEVTKDDLKTKSVYAMIENSGLYRILRIGKKVTIVNNAGKVKTVSPSVVIEIRM